eukprot:TRINITY_DN11357_c0_g1_i1.p1 TRINITY_DN11357_c0_g1~~TRINITY_DN11357_c0_g1_i1.p1  ORF type:complete len:260 (-),score=63.47 TRINITY_DN11357_c0_g1_i1:247-1026(-)
MAGRGRGRGKKRAEISLSSENEDAGNPMLFASKFRNNVPLPRYPDIPRLPPRPFMSEKDAQLSQISKTLNEIYASSGYYLTDPAKSFRDVDRYRDRYDLLDQQRRQLFDESSLAIREFPPELSQMADIQTRRRRKIIETQQKFVRNINMRAGGTTAAVMASAAVMAPPQAPSQKADIELDPKLSFEEKLKLLEEKEAQAEDMLEEEAEAPREADDADEQFEDANEDEGEVEDDYALNYFDNGEDDDESAFGRDEGPTLD